MDFQDFAARLGHFVKLLEALLPLHRLQSMETLQSPSGPPRPNVYAGRGYGGEILGSSHVIRRGKPHPERDTNKTVITIGELPNVAHATPSKITSAKWNNAKRLVNEDMCFQN